MRLVGPGFAPAWADVSGGPTFPLTPALRHQAYNPGLAQGASPRSTPLRYHERRGGESDERRHLHLRGVAQSFARQRKLCGPSFRFARISMRAGPCKDTYFISERLLSTVQAAEFEQRKLCATCYPLYPNAFWPDSQVLGGKPAARFIHSAAPSWDRPWWPAAPECSRQARPLPSTTLLRQ
jgi:hypothetical protein